MVFNSYTFAIFFCCVLLMHNLPIPWRLKKLQLLVASYVFYAAWNPPFVFLLSSNIAWGQDLLYLSRWLQSHPEVETLGLAVHARFDPQVAGIQFTLPPRQRLADSERANTSQSAAGPRPGWYAVDANMLRGFPYMIPDGRGGRVSAHDSDFTYFRDVDVAYRIGYSIYIYHLSLQETERLRRNLDLPSLSDCSQRDEP